MSKIKRWSKREDEVLIRLREEGKSISEIAKTLKRTYSATQSRICKMINECRVEKKCRMACKGIPSKVTEQEERKLLRYVSESPWNIREAFRRYSKESGLSVSYISRLYYTGTSKRQKLKNRGVQFTIIGKKGFTTNNSKNTNTIYRKSTLWDKIKNIFILN